jgi:hypothetical protein
MPGISSDSRWFHSPSAAAPFNGCTGSMQAASRDVHRISFIHPDLMLRIHP